MKLFFVSIFLLSILLFTNCDREFIPEIKDSIVGIWVLEEYKSDTAYLSSKNVLDKDKPGYIFYENGELIERKN